MSGPRRVSVRPSGAGAAGDDAAEPSQAGSIAVTVTTTAMGGRLAIHLSGVAGHGLAATLARTDAARALSRIERWADRLTRHSETSDLAALNRDPRSLVDVGPTLAAVLESGAAMGLETDGIVDVALLDERLAAEGIDGPDGVPSRRGWWLDRRAGRSALVARTPGLRFDLDGVAKGWIADRALGLLGRWPNAVVDADGDLAVRVALGHDWQIAVDDPRSDGANLAILRLRGGPIPERWGVATSGTSVHRWLVGDEVRHHLIDPRTGRSAVTDVVQATVVAGSALRAEALAKAVVIAGSAAGFALLERAGVRGAVVLTETGETIALPATIDLLVA